MDKSKIPPALAEGFDAWWERNSSLFPEGDYIKLRLELVWLDGLTYGMKIVKNHLNDADGH